jgi:hypothetical protein
MKANVGDWLVVKGRTNEQAEQRGMITEMHAADGSPPYMVRWLNTGHEALVFPGLMRSSSHRQSSRRPTSGLGHDSLRCRRQSRIIRPMIVKPADAHYDEIRPLTSSERRQLTRLQTYIVASAFWPGLVIRC